MGLYSGPRRLATPRGRQFCSACTPQEPCAAHPFEEGVDRWAHDVTRSTSWGLTGFRVYRFHEAPDSPRDIPQACCYCGREVPAGNLRYYLMRRTDREKTELPPAQVHIGCLRRLWLQASTDARHVEYSAAGARVVIIGRTRSPILYLANGHRVQEVA